MDTKQSYKTNADKLKTIEFNGFVVDSLIKTNEITVGDMVVFTEDVYNGNFFNSSLIGKRTIVARVFKQSYGQQYITFSMEVLEAMGCNSQDIIDKKFIRKKEPNLFNKYAVYRQLWKNEINRYYLIDSQMMFKYSLEQNIS